MRIDHDGSAVQLTYCTNIHPANGWDEVIANLRRYAPALKARLAPDRRFGLGLRLSGAESRELLRGDRLGSFKAYLDQHGMYVLTLNGFPYGPFHGQPVKADVHAPDWHDEKRVQYTLRLVEILATLLPEGIDGGISTNPLSYRAWVDPSDATTWQHFVANVVRVAAELVRLRRDRGTLIHLDLEPEPDGLLDNTADLLRFFADWLLPIGAPVLAETVGLARSAAEDALREHVRVCLDTCHAAVGFEDPAGILDCFEQAGIRIGKVQVGSALEVTFPSDGADRLELAGALRPFTNSVYLHQVVQRDRDGALRRYPDLPDALAAIDDPSIATWRIHFHTPLFVERYGQFASTQDWIRRGLALIRERRAAAVFEIETYTWDVLPPDLKVDLVESITREYDWVLRVLA